MSVISSFEATPNRIAIVYRFLQGYQDGMDETELAGILAPRALQKRGGGEDSSTLAAGVLREAKRLGLVETIAAGVVGVPPALRGMDDAGLLQYLETTLLHPARAEQMGQAQFPRALAWLLLQDPAEPLTWSDNHRDRVEADCGSDSNAFELTEPSRFQNMVYWARYLGYAWLLKVADRSKLVLPDPTVALERHIYAVLHDHREATVAELVNRLSERSPVLEGGIARREVEALLSSDRRRPEGALSRSTSLALMRLRRRRTIDLERRADAPAIQLASWPDEVSVSHVILHS